MERLEELNQQYIFNRLKCLKWDLKYHKHKNTQIARELEESDDAIIDILEEIHDLKDCRDNGTIVKLQNDA